jgi:hypothetical protein
MKQHPDILVIEIESLNRESMLPSMNRIGEFSFKIYKTKIKKKDMSLKLINSSIMSYLISIFFFSGFGGSTLGIFTVKIPFSKVALILLGSMFSGKLNAL